MRIRRSHLFFAAVLAYPLALTSQEQPGDPEPDPCPGAGNPHCNTYWECLKWEKLPDGEWACSKSKTTLTYYQK
jgi:hypothetical protein